MLFTTGKNPGIFSREIASALSFAVPESRVEFRGKRTLSSIIAKARKLHFDRVCSIHSEQGKAAFLSFLKIGDDGSWERLSPIISVKGIVLAPRQKAGTKPVNARAKLAPPMCLKITGAKAKVLEALVSPKNQPDAEPSVCSRMTAGAKTISVFVGKKKTLALGVSYEK